MKNYDHKKIEGKWQKEWEKKKIYYASRTSTKPKFYSLIEFPYPSGEGLHVGHPRPYTGMDVISRKRRMQGYNVLYPIGWDAFGLPTENYAIKTGKDPRVVTKKNTDTFRRQIKSLGVSFDWSREVNTTDPKYYKWTQWIFLKFLEKGLAYKAKMPINWCPKDKTGLANEEVVDGRCERCGTLVEKREKEQWMLAITKYADRLYKDLDDVDYLPQTKLAQRNWIKDKEGNLKLRDWVFSRQRYWGEPIPVIHCQTCGVVPVPEKDLPVVLPKVKKYQPTDSGESPLANVSKWVNVACPKCKGSAKRETDTMPNWAGSSWYFLRYTDHKNSKKFADSKQLKYWMPVDWYNGGNEHTTLHLLYSRFWNKFLFDLGLVPTSEPYLKRTSHGIILAEGGEKMSKSKGNVVNPDTIVKTYGADTLRVYEMFMGPFDQAVAWSEESIIGSRRFLEKVWSIGAAQVKNSGAFALGDKGQGTHDAPNSSPALTKFLHKIIKKVSEDIEAMKFNTAISSLMIFLNENDKLSVEVYKTFLKLLSPFAPHITEELWSLLGEKKSIHVSSWPKWQEGTQEEKETKIIIQVNGKVRAEIIMDTNASEEDVKKQALALESVSKYTVGQEIKKVIYIKNKLINIVV